MTFWHRSLFLIPLLAGCATGPTLDQRLSTFIGRGEGDLVGELGVPVRVYEADGRRFLEFERRRSIAVAQPPPPVFAFGFGAWGGYSGYFGPPPPAIAQVSCFETFTLREGRVIGFTYRGEGC